MLIRTHKAWERRPCPATSSPFATTTTSRSWRRSTALPCRPSRATARPAVGAPAGSRGPLALGRPAGVDARDRAGRDHQHHGARAGGDVDHELADVKFHVELHVDDHLGRRGAAPPRQRGPTGADAADHPAPSPRRPPLPRGLPGGSHCRRCGCRPRRRRTPCGWRPPRPASACRIRCSTRRSNSGPAPRLPPRSALPCRPGTSSTDRLVVGAPGAEEVFVLKGQSLGRVGELTEASAGLPPQAGDLFGATL